VRGYGSSFGRGTLTMECNTVGTTPPTRLPTPTPSQAQTDRPTPSPSTVRPTAPPTDVPSFRPTPLPTYLPSESPTQEPTFPPTNQPTNSPTPHPTKPANPVSIECGQSYFFYLSASEVWNPVLVLQNQGDMDITLSTCNPQTTFDTVLGAWGHACFNDDMGGTCGVGSECVFSSADTAGTIQISGYNSDSFGVGQLDVTCAPADNTPSANPPTVECNTQQIFSLQEGEVWTFHVNAQPGQDVSLSTCNSQTTFDTLLSDQRNLCYSDDLRTADCPLASACSFSMVENNQFTIGGFGGVSGSGQVDISCSGLGNNDSPTDPQVPNPGNYDYTASCGDEIAIDILSGEEPTIFVQAPANVPVEISTCNPATNFDTVIENHDGASCRNDDHYGCALSSQCTFTSHGEGHVLRLRGYSTRNFGHALVSITC